MNNLGPIAALGVTVDAGGEAHDCIAEEVLLVPVYLWRFVDLVDSQTPSDAGELLRVLHLGGVDANTPVDEGELADVYPPLEEVWPQGRMGLRADRRTFVDLQRDPQAQRESLVTFQPGIEVINWSVIEGACFAAAQGFTDETGIVRDVLQVRTLLDTGLTRVDSLAACISTEGTFFFDADEEFLTPFVWDQSYWDIGDADGVDTSSAHYWDQAPRLAVHLFEDENPNRTSVMAYLGFFIAGRTQVQPTLGVEKIANANLEDWASATDAEEMTESVTGTGWTTPTQELVTVYKGTSAAVFSSSGLADGSSRISAPLELAAGVRYRATAIYRLSADSSPVFLPFIRVGETGNYLLRDGRSSSAARNEHTFTGEPCEFRRVIFDFIAPAGLVAPTLQFGAKGPAGAHGSVIFDTVSVKPIHRFNLYMPRLGEAAIPDLETGSGKIIPEGQEVGLGALSLIDSDGFFSRLYGRTFFGSKPVTVYTGGVFVDGAGNQTELDFSDAVAHFTGFVNQTGNRDDMLTLDLRDFRNYLTAVIAAEPYTEVLFPNMDARRIGTKRPLLIGEKWYIDPNRIALDPTFAKYGVYELCDCSRHSAGIDSVLRVYAYVDETAAAERQGSKRLLLTEGTHYSTDLVNGRLTIEKDVQPIIIDATNNKADFDIAGAELTATVGVGIYTAASLCAALQTAMNAVSSGWTVTYSDATNMVTVARSSGVPTLRTKTGTNKEISIWPVVGFQLGDNRTGGLTFTGEDSIFVSADRDHILRVDARGLKDTAAGTYTGTPDALIEKGCDIALWVTNKYLGQPVSSFNTTALATARVYAAESLCEYINTDLEVSALFSKLEASNLSQIVIAGNGEIFYNVPLGEVPASTITIREKDIVAGSFDSSGGIAEIYARVSIDYDPNADDGRFQRREASFAAIELRYGRTAPRVIPTMVRSTNVAETLAARYLTLSRNPPRTFRFAVRGLLFLHEVSDKLRVERRNVLGSKWALRGEPLRIVGLKKNPQTGIVTVTAVDDASTLAGVICISTCQDAQELPQPDTCSDACEAGNCQEGCQANLQGCGINVCQESCQGATCQGCGQTVTQDACGVNCQEPCESGVQGGGCGGSACQEACQGCGQAGGCQDACETATQCTVACEQSTQEPPPTNPCATSCQNCQDACEGGTTQDPCSVFCQDGCQGGTCQYVQSESPIVI